MRKWMRIVSFFLAVICFCVTPLGALAYGEDIVWFPGFTSSSTPRNYGGVHEPRINGEIIDTVTTDSYLGMCGEVFTMLPLPENMSRTFSIEDIGNKNITIYPVGDERADFSHMVPYTAVAEDGRYHRIYMMASSRTPMEWTEEEYQEWLDMAPLMLEYRDKYEAFSAELDNLYKAKAVEIGGYHPIYKRMLNCVLQRTLWDCVATNEMASFGVQLVPYTEETLRAYMKGEGPDPNGFYNDHLANDSNMRRIRSFTVDQWKEFLTTLGDYWYDFAENTRISDPVIVSYAIGPYQGVVDGDGHVTVTVPEDETLSDLGDPVIGVDGDLKVNLFGGDINDGKLMYGVTPWEPTAGILYDGVNVGGEDGMDCGVPLTKTWVVEIKRGEPTLQINSLQVRIGDRIYRGKIDHSEKKITLKLPNNTRLEELDFQISHTAETCEISQDYQTLTLKTGEKYRETYQLEITYGPSEECDLISYEIERNRAKINGTDVSITVPYGTDLDKAEPVIEISDGASIKEKPVRLAYDTPLSYVIAAESGVEKKYTVQIHETPAATGNQILSFSYGSVTADIDQDQGTIQMKVPAGTDIAHLRPTIGLSGFASVTPASGEAVDFTQPVEYTVTSQSGRSNTYRVTVTVDQTVQANPYKASMETLVSRIISRYRTQASTDWEWFDIGLYDHKQCGSGADLPAGFDLYQQVKELEVTKNTAMTEYARGILMLTALGVNASDLDLYGNGEPFTLITGGEVSNLVEGLYNYGGTYTINGPTFALLALDMGNYTVPDNAVWTREKLLEELLAGEFTMSYGLDMVGAVMYAIAPYQDDPVYGARVRARLEQGIELLCENLQPNYTFSSSMSGVNSETAGWIIAALCSMGIDCHTDPRFSDGNGKSVLTAYLDFADIQNGYFAHMEDSPKNPMATEQGCYVTQWYLEFLKKQEQNGAGTPCCAWYHRFDFGEPLSSEARIETFWLEGQEGVIDQEAGSILVTLPEGASLEGLTPRMELSKGAALLAPSLPVNFVKDIPQPFTVVAEDGQTKKVYSVTVTTDADVQGKGAELNLSTIVLKDQNQRTVEILDQEVQELADAVRIELTVAEGIDLTKLFLKAELSFGAVSDTDLTGSTLLDLSDWKNIIITSQDGEIRNTYQIRVQQERYAEITGFSLQVGDGVYPGTINGTNILVSGVPASADLTAAVPDITLAEGTTVCNPLPGIPQDFTSPVSYTVSGTGLKARTYTVTVVKEGGSSDPGPVPPAVSAKITAFTLLGEAGEINQETGRITVTLPEGTDVSHVRPQVETGSGCTVSPASGEVVDLRQPVTYIVTNGTETSHYTVVVVLEKKISQQLWEKLEENSNIVDHQVIRD